RTKFSDQTDVYALSALFYLLITGMVPQESLARVSEDRLLPFSEFELDEKIPKDVSNAIFRGMAIDRSIRFKSVRDLEAGIEGRKVTDAPEVLRAKRKVRNRIAITIGSLTIVALLALIPLWHTYFRPKNGLAVGPSTEAQISILVTKDEEDMYNILIREFEKEFPKIRFTLIAVPESDYETKFIEMSSAGNTPSIYLNHLVRDASEPPKAKLDRLYRSIGIEYAQIDQMNYEGSDWIAFSLDFPVMYYNLDLLDEIDFSTSQITDDSFEENVDLALKQEGIEASALAISDEIKAWFSHEDNMISDQWDSMMDQVMTEKDFLEEKVVFYIDKASKLRMYQDKMPGYVGVALHPSFKEASLPGGFTNKFSIPESLTGNERDATMFFLYYLMNDYAQNVMTVQNDNGYPLNMKLQSLYLDSHQDLDEYADLLDNISIVE
ncbi:MAG: extracellular solute-binding protein, partial [Oscillospiraceae bacterium]|nr:extracellular solute-binding protein [Oscillospiraceae bacterium]